MKKIDVGARDGTEDFAVHGSWRDFVDDESEHIVLAHTSADALEVEVEVPADGPLHRITFAKSGKTFDCPENLTILQAARLAGVPMPSSCAKGVCGTCKCMKTSGSVDMNHGGGIRDREVARGFILPCSSRPLSDIVLDR